jgi:hypothetical protein
MVSSSICKYSDCVTDWYREWSGRIGETSEVSESIAASYRKIWEWSIILEAIRERNLLLPGKRALGFAVGREPIPSTLAAYGVDVLATDLGAAESEAAAWLETAQHAASKDNLYKPDLVDRKQFDERVSFQPADMRTLENLPSGFDLIWSSCAMEHLGSRRAGLDFARRSLQLLKRGGMAFHTTEFNIMSPEGVDIDPSNCVYGKNDLELFGYELRDDKAAMEHMNFDMGHHQFDLNYDQPPYFQPGSMHFKLKIGGVLCTSSLMILHKY